MARILNGKEVACEVKNLLARDVQEYGLHPTLTVLQVGDDPASNVYVRNKRKACEEVGINFNHVHLPANVQQHVFEGVINDNQYKSDGFIIQLPIPAHLHLDMAQRWIIPEKDVDGFKADSPYIPCTPLGIMMLLNYYKIDLVGKHAVVVGRSDIVGKPMALELLKKDCTVTICHSKTFYLPQYTQDADILVSAVGKPNFIKPGMIKPNAIIIDVGMNRDNEGHLCGDVHPQIYNLPDICITPVPGGVGPMTVAALLSNTVRAAHERFRNDYPLNEV